jgi:hypothetical protein
MVQYSELISIHKAWVAAGSPPHVPRVEREYYIGTDGGDDGCLVCGESWSRRAGSHPAESILRSDEEG